MAKNDMSHDDNVGCVNMLDKINYQSVPSRVATILVGLPIRKNLKATKTL